MALPCIATATEWRIQTVDSVGNVGYEPSLALDSDGYPHISYYDDNNDDLKYAYWDGIKWQMQTVDSEDNVGWYTSLALDSIGYPHISYHDSTNGNLKYAYWDGANWQIETVDSKRQVGEFTSLALDSIGYPHISYFDRTNHDLKYAYWDGADWQMQTVDSEDNVGWYTSLALDSIGYPHISYHDSTNGNLKYAYWDGANWQIQTVDSEGSVGSCTSLALDSDDYPHISYRDLSNDDLKYAYLDGADWQIVTVDSEGQVGEYTSLALDSIGYPHISYWDLSNHDLKYAYWDGANWQIETVDSEGDVGRYTSLALDSNDYPHISYWDLTNYDLKYATLVPPDTTPPTPNTIASIVAVSSTQIDLTSTEATDDTPPVFYRLDGQYYDGAAWGDSGGGVSDYDYSTTRPNPWSDTNLVENGWYRYRQLVKDSADPPNESEWSDWVEKATLLNPPQDAEITFANVTATGMDVTVATPPKPSGAGETGAYFDLITGEGQGSGATDRGYADDYTAEYTNLNPNTQYGWKVKYRNRDGVETDLGPAASGTTVESVPTTILIIAPSIFGMDSGKCQLLTATLRDENDIPISGRSIRWEATWGAFYPDSGITDASGQVFTYYYATWVDSETSVTITAFFTGDETYLGSSDTATGTIAPLPTQMDSPLGSFNPWSPNQTPPLSEIPPGVIQIGVSASGFNPNEFRVVSGYVVSLTVTSLDEWTHVFKFEDSTLSGVAIGLSSGETRGISFIAPAPGDYTFYCSVPGHRERGEIGVMHVIAVDTTQQISGIITDGVNPISATVQAWQNGTMVKEVETPDGYYVISGLQPGTYAIRAYSDGYYAAVLPDEITPPAEDVNLSLTQAPTITATNKVCDFWCQDNTIFDWQSQHIPVLVQIGDVITARDPDGIICGITTVGEFGTDEGDYFIHVYGDDATTPGVDEGAVEGDTIKFFINGYPASVTFGTPQWHSGGSFEVCLSATITKLGDVSGNGEITAYDASLVLQHVVGLRELSPDERKVADVTGDDTISALDAAWILQYTVGLITSFPGDSPPIAPSLNPKTETKLLAEAIKQLESIPLTKEQKKILEQLKSLISACDALHDAFYQAGHVLRFPSYRFLPNMLINHIPHFFWRLGRCITKNGLRHKRAVGKKEKVCLSGVIR